MSPFPQDLHGECLPKDHVMSHRVYILPGTNQFRVSKTLEHSEYHATPAMFLSHGTGDSSSPSPRPYQDAVVALGLQRAICGYKDSIGFGSLNLGNQFVVLGMETGNKGNMAAGAGSQPPPRPSLLGNHFS